MAPMRLTVFLTAMLVVVTASHGRGGGKGENSVDMRGGRGDAAHGRGGRVHTRRESLAAPNMSRGQRGVGAHEKRRQARSKAHHVGRSSAGLRGGKQELCSHSVPGALLPSGITGLCVVIDEGTSICSGQVMMEVKLDGDQGAVIFDKPLNVSELQTCATAQEMQEAPIIVHTCSNNAKICVDFMRDGQNTLGEL